LALARRCGIGTQIRTLAMCAGPDDDGVGLARVAARLYADGLPTTAFDSLYGDDSLTLKRLPPYAFGDGTRFWRELDLAAPAMSAPVASSLPDADDAAPTPAAADGVAARIHQVIAEIGGYPPEEINPHALLGEDLGYDSLLQLRLIERLRAEYPQLEDATLEELVRVIKDVDDVVRYVEARIGKEATTP
jgi:acyl carrier protein